MLSKQSSLFRVLLLSLMGSVTMVPVYIEAASCKTQSQMTVAERDAVSSAARAMVGQVQVGNVQGLRQNTIAAVAADFGGIADSVSSLRPLLQQATITVNSLYLLDASNEPTSATRTDFYCGTPVVVMNFVGLPPGLYALAIVQTSGIAKPQQISLILSESGDHRWMLGGLFSRPMTDAGHDGLWYWASARKFAQNKMSWDAWFYYREAAYLLDPADFLSSPNLEKVKYEEGQVHPENLPGTAHLILDANGSRFEVTTIDTSSTFGTLDLEVHYTPDAAQRSQLRDPPTARIQVTQLMTELLAAHPELLDAFHGIWVNADIGTATLFSLELSMDQIAPARSPASRTHATVLSTTQDPTQRKMQLSMDVDRDPIPSLDVEDNSPVIAAAVFAPSRPGEIQKRQDGTYTLHQDVDEVLLTCAVIDEKGRAITDLNRADFHIWEDGIPQATSSFLHQDQPISLGIVVDNSGSMLDKRAVVAVAALNLLRASNPQDSTFIVNFSDRAFLDQGFTSNIDALGRGLSHSDTRGTTALYDAVAASADELASHSKLPKQVLLVITDGADNASHLNLEQAIRRVQNLGGPVVYSIGLLFGAEKDEAARARTALVRLSEGTGGIAYFPHSLEDVNKIAAEVARDIRDQYTIGFRSTKAASMGGYRVIRVEASAPKHGKMVVRTRKGYFTEKPVSKETQASKGTGQ